MSNVTLDEIVDLTADAFSVPRDEMRRKGQTKHVSWRTYARYCAVMLGRRHTEVGPWTLRKALGMTGGGTQVANFYRLLERFEQEAEDYPVLKAIIDKIEDRIEALHESRVSDYLAEMAIRKAPRKAVASPTAVFSIAKASRQPKSSNARQRSNLSR